jgi:hypothetical protein
VGFVRRWAAEILMCEASAALRGALSTLGSSPANDRERLVWVDVRWEYLDEQGRSAQQNGYRYVLRLEEEASPRIQVVIGTR